MRNKVELRRNTCAANYAPTAALSTNSQESTFRRVPHQRAAYAPGRTNEASRPALAAVLVQLVAPRLQAAADLAAHLRLRQRDARIGRHFGDDRHIVVGPGHRLHAPLLQRPVGAAR